MSLDNLFYFKLILHCWMVHMANGAGIFNEPLSTHVFNYGGYVWDARVNPEEWDIDVIDVTTKDTMNECEVECSEKTWCFSFNYNPREKTCELLPTDATLFGKTHEEIREEHAARSWVYRYLGKGKTKGCNPSRSVFPECISITQVETNGVKSAQWTLPGDKYTDGSEFRCESTNGNEDGILLEQLTIQTSEDKPVTTGQKVSLACNVRVQSLDGATFPETEGSTYVYGLSVRYKGKNIMQPLNLIGLVAPPQSTIGVEEISADQQINSELTVTWQAAAFGGQSDVDTVRVFVVPNDGSCHEDGSSYCVIFPVDATKYGSHKMTGLTPGRAYDVYLQLYRTRDGAVSSAVKPVDSPFAMNPPRYTGATIVKNDEHDDVWDLVLSFSEVGEISKIEIELTDTASDGILVSEANFDPNVVISSTDVEMGITGTEGLTYSGNVTVYSAEQDADSGAVTPEAVIYHINNVLLVDSGVTHDINLLET